MAYRNIFEQKETPDVVHSVPQRPQTLLQRVSSILGSLPLRKRTPKQRPKSAPILRHSLYTERVRNLSREVDPEVLLPENLNIPHLSKRPCPNDSDVYYSFPNIEKRRCNSLLCGLGSDSTVPERTWPKSATASILQCTQSRPCTPGRAGLVCEHLSTSGVNNVSRQHSLSSNRKVNATERSPTVSRTPTPLRVRFSNQDCRDISVSRLPSLNTLTSSRGSSPIARPPTRHGGVPQVDGGFTFDTLKENICPSTPKTRDSPSPKLHHVFGNKDRPYVYRHEAKQYLASLQAGGQPDMSILGSNSSARSHTGPTTGKRPRAQSDVTGQDSSQTVFYPRGGLPVPASRKSEHTQLPALDFVPYRPSYPVSINENSVEITSTLSKAARATPTVETIPACGSITLNTSGRPISVNLELETSCVYRKHGGTQSNVRGNHSHNQQDGDSSQTPSTLGGKRLELRGGSPKIGMARLRGGGRQNSPASFSSVVLLMKKATLTCCDEDWSDDDEPPSRAHYPCSESHCRHQIRIPLPRIRGCCRQSGPDCVPQLRGGGRISRPSPVPKLQDDDRLPAGLWHLAGGRGPPITVREWDRLKSEKRLGGLVGMAVYGHKAGSPYRREDLSGRIVPIVAVNPPVGEGSKTAGSPTPGTPGSSSPSHSVGVDRGASITAGQDEGGNTTSNASAPALAASNGDNEPHDDAAETEDP